MITEGDAVLVADGNIIGFDATHKVQAETINLLSRHGSLGSDGSDLIIDTGSSEDGVLIGQAMDAIFLTEDSGDLYLQSLYATDGDVRLTVEAGSLYDANEMSTVDEEAIAKLTALWDKMAMTGQAAEDALAQTLQAYENAKTRDYQSYWQYRMQQDNPAVYDSSFKVSLSDTERQWYLDNGYSESDITTLENQRTQQYHDLHVVWGGMGDSFDADYSYQVVEGSDEYNEMAEGYKWTEEQLANTFHASSFREKTDTETTIEQANIIGADVQVDVSGGIGTVGTSETIALDGEYTDDEKVLMAAAEADDMVFYSGVDGTGDILDPLNSDISAQSLVVTLHDDLDITATGNVTVTAGNHIYLGSEQDINIDAITSGTTGSRDTISIKTQQGIISATANTIAGKDIILEAANGAIGSEAIPVLLNLDGGHLVARAEGDIVLQADGDCSVQSVYSASGDIISLTAAGSIVDGTDNDLWKIKLAGDLVLDAGDTIGESGNALEIDTIQPTVEEGEIIEDVSEYKSVISGGNVWLTEVVGDMYVEQIVSTGDVFLSADVSILDSGDGTTTSDLGNTEWNIQAHGLTLEAGFGAIGAADNHLEIDLVAVQTIAAIGLLNTSSRMNTYLVETTGDLFLGQVSTGVGSTDGVNYTAYIASLKGASTEEDGAIYNGLDSGSNVVSGRTRLFGTGDIGTEAAKLNTVVGELEGTSTTGNVYIENTGALIVGMGGEHGVKAEGSIEIIAHSPVTVSLDMISGSSILIETDDDSDNDDIVIEAGVTLETTGGDDITLRSGDNIIVEAEAVIDSSGNVVFNSDAGGSDSQGSRIDLQGTVIASEDLTITGNDDLDIFDLQGDITANEIIINGMGGDDILALTELKLGVDATVDMGAGDDLVNLGSMAQIDSNTGGVVDTISGLLSISGSEGYDTLHVDDSGDEDGNIGTLTQTTITGLGMAEGIEYGTLENIIIDLGMADDTFNVQGTASGADTRLNGNDGNDISNISSDAPDNQGDLENIQGDLHIDGGEGTNQLTISARGNTTGRTVTIDENGIHGLGSLGSSASITYEASGNFNGGFELLFGSGNDSVTVYATNEEVSTLLYLGDGDGDDQLTLHDQSSGQDGLVIGFGEGGDDQLDAADWDNDIILVGDGGSAVFVAGQLSEIRTTSAPSDGDDTLSGGAGDDLLIGGNGNDSLYGQGGNDVLLGDNGLVFYTDRIITFVQEYRNAGGDDILDGGKGSDLMMGGLGNNTIHGDLFEDLIYNDGWATFSLTGVRGIDYQESGDVSTAIEDRQFADESFAYNPVVQEKEVFSEQERRIRRQGGTAVRGEQGNIPQEIEVDKPIEKQELKENQDVPVESKETDNLVKNFRKSEQNMLENRKSNGADLKMLVAGISGWGVASGGRKTKEKRLNLNNLKEISRKKGNKYRWVDGMLEKDHGDMGIVWDEPVINEIGFRHLKKGDAIEKRFS